MEKNRSGQRISRWRWQKLLMMMKLFLVCMCFFSLGLSAKTMAQKERVNLNLQEVSFQTLFNEIQRQTNLAFLFNHEVVDRLGTVSVNAENETVEEVLNSLFEETGLTYLVKGDMIVVKEKEKLPQPQKVEMKKITGQVKDEAGNPLPGVTVLIKGTTVGTATNIEGKYSLTVPDRALILVFSMVGMVNWEETVGSRTEIDVVMKNEVVQIDEVVITGYQNLKRESTTGSYTIISSNEMEKRFTGDVVSNLEGKIPGLVYDSNKEGEEAITIRGVSTFEARRSPLIVVDGLPIEGGIETVNPYDIENITVLKDAAAAAIYGARASNGVIVITSKKAKNQNLSIDFNADLTISGKQDYDNMNWASASDIIALEKYNFNAMLKEAPDQIKSNLEAIDRGNAHTLSKVMRVLLENHRGNINDDEMNTTFNQWSQNDYRREWQDLVERTKVSQRYNVGIRVKGKILSSSIVLNYMQDNGGQKGIDNSQLTFKYIGDLKAMKWLDLSLGVEVLNRRNKSNPLGSYGDINSFMPYESIYNADGSRVRMEADIYPYEKALSNELYELKDVTFNLADEIEGKHNNRKSRYTNIRSHINALVRLPIEGWTAQAQFQYEDIYRRDKTLYGKESQIMRSVYNRYTTAEEQAVWVEDPDFDYGSIDWSNPNIDWEHLGQKQVIQTIVKHRIPYGDALSMADSEDKYYTFRAQTRYSHEFSQRHNIDVVAGFEYRQTHSSYETGGYYGYDRQTSSNLNMQTDWSFILNPKTGVLGSSYTPTGNRISFNTSETLHRYYSYYFTGNYVYDNRYSISGSYRVDKSDLFGTDPKFRGKPLWSAGASWNMHHEEFMRPITWIDALKVRASYGLTGNIDNSVSSYLTASMGLNQFGKMEGELNTPPNDQLRWEKTATWNAGIDFGLFGYRIAGSLDYYRKDGSDLLTNAELDPSTGWTLLKINSAKLRNTGIELQLNGQIIPARKRSDFGINLSVNIASNRNEVKDLKRYPNSADDFLNHSYKKGYPMGALFSIRYAGLVEKDGLLYVGWYDKNGEVRTESRSSKEFTMDDIVYSGTSIPKISGSISPEIKWQGLSLSAMMAFYGGHYMRVDNEAWTHFTDGSQGTGLKGVFGITSFSKDLLKYWEGEDVPANGYMATMKNGNNINMGTIRDTNIEHAGYLKIRNIILSYEFDQKVCRKIGLNNLRLRFQMNNIATWARNSRGIDPEAYDLRSGTPNVKAPTSYTMSLFFNL